MTRLTAYVDALGSSEDWILARLMQYSTAAEYTRYTSTREEDWRMTINGPRHSLIAYCQAHDLQELLHVDEKFSENPSASFGVHEAKAHRARGVGFAMFLGLSKLVRQCFTDLAYETLMPDDDRRRALEIVYRFFDKFELGFSSEWLSHTESELLGELQEENRLLTNAKNKYQLAFESMPDPAFVTDRDMRIIEANHALEELVGVDAGAAVGRRCHELLECTDSSNCPLEACLKDGTSLVGQEEVVRPRGRQFDVQVRGGRIIDISGKYAGAMAIFQDVTDRKRRQEQLERRVEERTRDLTEAHAALAREVEVRKLADAEAQRANALLATVIEGTTDIVFVKDREGRYLVMNGAGSRLLGRPVEEILGRTDDELVPAEDAQAMLISDREILQSGDVATVEEPLTLSTGERRTFLTTKGPLRDHMGRVRGLFGIARDVTDYKKLEASFHQSQRMEAIGTMAGGIAHDFNNLMVPILGNADVLLLKHARNDETHEMLEEIAAAARRAGELAHQMVAFARGGKVNPTNLDLNAVVRDVLRVQQRTAPKRVQLEATLSKTPVTIRADATQLSMVVMNLLINAVEAVDDVGIVRIATEWCSDTAMPNGACVRLIVQDNGCGMTPETLAHVFEPFFTTKFLGRGLGMAATYGIVKNHGGQIDVTSVPGEGSRFVITFPASDAQGVADAVRRRANVETVLLVDDEPWVLSTGTRMLESLGYHVITARDGREAIDIATHHPDNITTVVLDLGMPVMGGAEAFPILRSLREGRLRILLCSGYEISETARDLLADGATGFLRKPFELRDLTAVMRAGAAR